MKIRDILPKQDSILDANGQLKVGVFEDYFTSFNLLDRKLPFMQKFRNKNTLTEWQAIEVLHDDIFLITAVFKMGIMNKSLCFVYDIKTHNLTNYSSTSLFKNKSNVSPSLTSKGLSRRETDTTLIEILNELEKDTLTLNGHGENLKYCIDFKRIAKPVVISLPMSKKHTVYTEKDLLVPKGKIIFNDKEYELSDKHITILDDHRGYYPLSSGYDWFTCMGNITHKGVESKFGVNLTSFYRNLDDSISENGYWLNGLFHQLPNVHFTRNGDIWTIKDDDAIVSLTFKVHNQYKELKNVGFKIDYTLAFGEVSGTIKVSDTETITINQMFSLGEKRITKRPFKCPYMTKKKE